MRKVRTRRAWCIAGGKAAAARGSSWFSRKRAQRRWKSRPADRWPRTAGGVAGPQPVVEPFVVGVVEALLLQFPFQVPVHLGQEQEVRPPGLHGRRWPPARTAPPPERRRRPAATGRPRSRESPPAAAAWPCRSGRRRSGRRSTEQLADHRLTQSGMAVIQLERVGPAGEVRVAAVGQDRRTAAGRQPNVVVRLAGQVGFRCRGCSIRDGPGPRGGRGRCGWARNRASGAGRAAAAARASGPGRRRRRSPCGRCTHIRRTASRRCRRR